MVDVNTTIANLDPQEVWKQFVAITAIPRCSKCEQNVSNYVIQLAEQKNLSWQKDDYGNIVVKKPATNGSICPLILQSHLDIVCECVPEKNIDMRTTPPSLQTDGQWVFAEGTTLGADDGIGVALMLAVLSGDYSHPPLEALFTIDEETGLRGALHLDKKMLEGKRLINIDSDEAGVFCIGSAGGQTTHGTVPIQKIPCPEDYKFFTVQIGGLSGGHSGTTIHEGRANAIKLLARILTHLPIVIAELDAGSSRHNAIPRDARSLIGVPSSEVENLKERMEERQRHFSQEFARLEPRLTVSCHPSDTPATCLDTQATATIVRLLLTVPSGMLERGRLLPGVVEASCNFAGVWLKEKEVSVITSQRSMQDHAIVDIGQVVSAAIVQAGGKAWINEQYPAWAPHEKSELVQRLSSLYAGLYGKSPKKEVIHAGVECGVIRSRLGELDVISIGATIEGMHSPEERVLITSVGHMWQFLLTVLEKIDS